MSDNQVPFATLGNAIGFITKLDGSVTVQSIDGQERVVKLGDPIFFGETVLTGGSGSVTIAFVDGTDVVIGGDSIVEMTDEIYNTGDNEDLVADSSSEIDALQNAILAGDDPTLIQDAPAAGNTLADQQRVDVSIERNDNSAQAGFGSDTQSSLPTYGYDTDNGSSGQATGSEYSAPSSVRAVNQAPVVDSESVSVTEDFTISGSVRATDVDLPDGKALSFSTSSTVTGLIFNSNGTYSFDASSYDSLVVGEKKEILIDITATDDQGSQGTGQLIITVTGTNDAPIAQAAAAIVREDSTVSGVVTAKDVDLPAGASLKFAIAEEVKGLTFNQNGSYKFNASDEAYNHLAAGERLTLKIPVTVTDDQGATDTTRLTINIVGTNDGPVALDDTATGTEDGGVITIDVLANDTDVDGDTLT
ncbi:retention module-containing protein, partial [Marinomonas primoryensis]